MTGLPGLNFAAFDEAAHHLRTQGYKVANPVEIAKTYPGQPDEFYLRKDIQLLMDCDGVVILPGWERSRGAELELLNALRLNIPVYEYPSMQPLTLIPIVRIEREQRHFA